jgi:uncharacterized membrane protein
LAVGTDFARQTAAMTQEPSPQQPILHHRARNETLVFRRLRSNQDRLADAITRFAGSMSFVYLHVGWFTVWIVLNAGLVGSALVFDDFPFGLLTMIVSLEAIFLSTFVMISQNREASRAEVRANLDFETNLTAEVLVRAIAKHTGVDMAAVNEMVRAEIERTEQQLAPRRT